MRFFISVIAGLCISASAYAQDSTELSASPYGFSERYLFSATVEGAEGLRVNPAVLGLGHYTNGRLSLF
ncbi:MAG TPA: hypothetical protein VEC36_12605, partial [Patescibacteria group bacterium]|nr:hypothetical protein [Patescibacteria group bacterium]